LADVCTLLVDRYGNLTPRTMSGAHLAVELHTLLQFFDVVSLRTAWYVLTTAATTQAFGKASCILHMNARKAGPNNIQRKAAMVSLVVGMGSQVQLRTLLCADWHRKGQARSTEFPGANPGLVPRQPYKLRSSDWRLQLLGASSRWDRRGPPQEERKITSPH
jgi:hypothetical protein